MKKFPTLSVIIIGLIGGFLLTGAISGCRSIAAETANRRYLEATATAKIYHEDGDFYSTEFMDADGNTYIVDNCVCNLYSDCTLTFYTQATDDFSDDEIIEVNVTIEVGEE